MCEIFKELFSYTTKDYNRFRSTTIPQLPQSCAHPTPPIPRASVIQSVRPARLSAVDNKKMAELAQDLGVATYCSSLELSLTMRKNCATHWLKVPVSLPEQTGTVHISKSCFDVLAGFAFTNCNVELFVGNQPWGPVRTSDAINVGALWRCGLGNNPTLFPLFYVIPRGGVTFISYWGYIASDTYRPIFAGRHADWGRCQLRVVPMYKPPVYAPLPSQVDVQSKCFPPSLENSVYIDQIAPGRFSLEGSAAAFLGEHPEVDWACVQVCTTLKVDAHRFIDLAMSPFDVLGNFEATNCRIQLILQDQPPIPIENDSVIILATLQVPRYAALEIVPSPDSETSPNLRHIGYIASKDRQHELQQNNQVYYTKSTEELEIDMFSLTI